MARESVSRGCKRSGYYFARDAARRCPTEAGGEMTTADSIAGGRKRLLGRLPGVRVVDDSGAAAFLG